MRTQNRSTAAAEQSEPRRSQFWGSVAVERVAEDFGVDPDRGLSGDEVEQRRDEYGPNRIERIARDPAWRLFLDQFRSPLILLLIGAATIAGVVGEVRDAVVIAAVLMINGVLGFGQEYRAQKSMAALQVAVVQIGPLADFFGTTPLGAAEWAIAAGAAASLLVLSEVARLVYRQRHEA